MIMVKSTQDDQRVVLWEVHADHPDGEVFVKANGEEFEVAETPAVLNKFSLGELVKVEPPKPKPAAKRAEAKKSN